MQHDKYLGKELLFCEKTFKFSIYKVPSVPYNKYSVQRIMKQYSGPWPQKKGEMQHGC